MDFTVKIAVLDSLFEAQMLESALKEQGIPHIIRSYHDLALDGLFQGIKGWGHVEAAEVVREAILAVLGDIRSSGSPDRGPGGSEQ